MLSVIVTFKSGVGGDDRGYFNTRGLGGLTEASTRELLSQGWLLADTKRALV